MEPATVLGPAESPLSLPGVFARWFSGRGWAPRRHQLELLTKARHGRSVLLIAPTGGGKTLAGFLPTLVELSERGTNSLPRLRGRVREGAFAGAGEIPPPGPLRGPISPASGRGEERRDIRRSQGLHTLYISPLKALAVDIARNLEIPVREMGLNVRLETRTGDTPASKRQRQRRYPPDILLTTPEQLALLLASADAPYLFGTLKRVVLDELHSLVTSKRGDLLSLGLARLFALAPGLTAVGLSATVAEPDDLARFLVPQPAGSEARADLVLAQGGAQPQVAMLDSAEHLPWAGHSARHALGEIYGLIKTHKTTLIFVNTRSQAEFLFQELWGVNDDNLAVALHHGSLDVAQRRKVEDAMVAGKLRAVVCTSSLDLGVDWGDVDLVINVGAPKGASRLLQRIGRSNHRLDEPSQAVLVPANRFEVLECRAAIDAVAENAQDTPPLRAGALDVLAQHILGRAVGAPFLSDELYNEVRAAAPYSGACPRRFRRRSRFRRHRRLRAESLRALCQDQAGQGRPLAHHPSARCATLPHECRHHRRSRHAESTAGALAPRRRHDPARRTVARPGRGILYRDARGRRHFRICRRNTEIRSAGRGRSLCFALDCYRSQGASLRRRQVPALDLSRGARARVARRSRRLGARSPTRCANGWRFSNGARYCQSPATCWSRLFRAPPSIILSAIRSRAGLRIRHWACC